MKPIQFENVLTDIRKSEIAEGYYICGDSLFMRDILIRTIRKKSAIELEEFNISEFWARELAEPKAVIDSILAIPMMSPRKLTIIYDVHSLSLQFKKELAQFNIPETSTVVLTSLSTGITLGEYHRKFKSRFCFLDASPPYENELGYWLTHFARSRHKRIGGPAIQFFLKRVTPTLLTIKSELEKICAYIGDRPEITVDDIGQVVSQSRTANIFQFIDSFGQKDFKACLVHSQELFNYGESAPMMIYWLQRRCTELLKLLAYQAQGVSASEIAKKMRISPYWIKSYIAQARNYKPRQIIQMIFILKETDLMIKGGNMGQKEAITYAICKISTLK
ncbi:DNA polymerase III subunit delta [bacterium]|nr:DNA polymerase III subunit delta [bacterium]